MHPGWNTNDIHQLDAASLVGADLVRIGVSWRLLEPQPGQWDMSWYVPQLDQLVASAHQRGLQVFFMLAETPCWASSAPNKDCSDPDSNADSYKWYPPINTGDYANAFRFLVGRYGNGIQAWEVWNEPNYDDENDHDTWGGAADVQKYTQMLRDSFAAIKTTDPHALVLGGSLAGTDTAYLEAMYSKGAQEYFDVLAIHPYTANGNTAPPDDCSNLLWSYKCGVENVRSVMLVHGDDLPIWFTEFGWSSFNGQGGVGEALQADYLDRSVELIQNWGYVRVATWYKLVDDGNSKEGCFGLFRQDFSLKLVAEAYWWIARPFRVYLPVVRLRTPNP